eukprot:Skav220571  [mRNA]  locus=scaffold145:86067:86324:- [translate_table: standard]
MISWTKTGSFEGRTRATHNRIAHGVVAPEATGAYEYSVLVNEQLIPETRAAAHHMLEADPAKRGVAPGEAEHEQSYIGNRNGMAT